MNRLTHQPLALLLAATLLGPTACGDTGDPQDRFDYPEPNYGALEISLEEAEPLRGELTGRLRIYEEILVDGEIELALAAEREFDTDYIRTLDVVYLDAGTYTVIAELLDVEGAAVMGGTRIGVVVLPGRMSSVTVVLSPSGGIQVDIAVTDLGARFVLDETEYAIVEPWFQQYRGVQRVEGDNVVYYGLASSRFGLDDPDAVETEYRLFRGSSVADMLTESEAHWLADSGLPSGGWFDLVDLSAAGDYLYALIEQRGAHSLSLYRSLEGTNWTLVAHIPVVIEGRPYNLRFLLDGPNCTAGGDECAPYRACVDVGTETRCVTTTELADPHGGYMTCEDSVWLPIPTTDIDGNEVEVCGQYDQEFDELVSGALYIDNQYNFLGIAIQPDPVAELNRWGAVHGFSRDGSTWSELLPYRFDESSEPDIDFGTDWGKSPDTWWQRAGSDATRVVDVVFSGGVYYAWVFAASWPAGAVLRDHGVYRLTSVDRRHWEGQNPLEGRLETSVVDWSDLSGRWYPSSIYQSDAGLVMLLYNLGSDSFRLAYEDTSDQICAGPPPGDCDNGPVRVMFIVDASSSNLNVDGGMVAGGEGETQWDAIHAAIPSVLAECSSSSARVQIDGALQTGLVVFGHNTPGEYKVVLDYTACAGDNLDWALNPWTSCQAPGCTDPWAGPTIDWTYLESSSAAPYFPEPTVSHMPLCNGTDDYCSGAGTYTHLGLELAASTIDQFRLDAEASGETVTDDSVFINILITDGQYNLYSTEAQVRTPLEAMRDDGTRTFVIGLGDGVNSSQAITQLQNMATWGSGSDTYWDVDDPADLAEAIRDILNTQIGGSLDASCTQTCRYIYP